MFKKLLKIFTRQYKRDTDYYEFIESRIDDFKLNDNSESVETKVERLIGKNNYEEAIKVCQKNTTQ